MTNNFEFIWLPEKERYELNIPANEKHKELPEEALLIVSCFSLSRDTEWVKETIKKVFGERK